MTAVFTLMKDLPVPSPPLNPTTVSYLMKYGLMIRNNITAAISITIRTIATAEEGAELSPLFRAFTPCRYGFLYLDFRFRLKVKIMIGDEEYG